MATDNEQVKLGCCDLWREGYTSDAIAAKLGINRNRVMGYVTRAGLTRVDWPAKYGAGGGPPRDVVLPINKIPRTPAGASPQATPPPARSAAAAPGVPPKGVDWSTGRVKDAPPPPARPIAPVARKPPAPAQSPPPAPAVTETREPAAMRSSEALVEPAGMKRLQDAATFRAGRGGIYFPKCQFIPGEPTGDAVFCGAKTEGGLQYCAEHWALTHRQAPPIRRVVAR